MATADYKAAANELRWSNDKYRMEMLRAYRFLLDQAIDRHDCDRCVELTEHVDYWWKQTRAYWNSRGWAEKILLIKRKVEQLFNS